MEIRYTVPYVSGLTWRLNTIDIGVPVQDAQGRQAVQVDRQEPGLSLEVTPYLGSVKSKVQTYDFEETAGDLPSMSQVLSGAGVDVAAAWQTALDSMANVFPILADPEVGDETSGLPTYLRLDMWTAKLDIDSPKSVTAVLGVYEDAEYTSLAAYIPLVFADGETLRQRQQTRSQLLEQVAQADSILADPPTYSGWEGLTADQRTQLTNQAPLTKKYAEDQIASTDAQLVADLEDLLGQATVQTSIGALVAACFSALKASHPAWADVEVATLMSRFALPDIS